MRSLSSANLDPLVQAFRDNAPVILASLALVLGALCAFLLRRLALAHAQLHRAQAAAEEAVRAAALAAPGGIDPEAVLEVLRRGLPPTLDNVYAAMQRHEARDRAEQNGVPSEEAVQVAVSPPG